MQQDVADEQLLDQLVDGSRLPTPRQQGLLVADPDAALELLVVCA